MINKQRFTFLLPLVIMLAGCGFTQHSAAQNNTDTILVDATGEAFAPADEIVFNININRFDSVATEAFSRHKELERFLTELILEQNIDEDHINAHPISISPRRSNMQEQGFQTSQSVTIRLEDLSQFEEMQLILIENGFDNFSASFSTTKADEAHQEALEKAVEETRKKAESLANSSGRELGEVLSIEYTSSSGFNLRGSGMMAMEAYDESLLEMQRTIPVRENVRVKFRLQ